ncbi:MAG: outer membrane beta-barrel domain-containing protein [Deltaproteobacteria bacterium]|nr:outer membrane beta-barrel domain-containing protein [Deltaproteobacteria bacterium]
MTNRTLHTPRVRRSFGVAIGLLLGLPAVGFPSLAHGADDDLEDLLDDVEPKEDTVRDEREALQDEPKLETSEEERRKRIIKTLQEKEFVHKGRYELAPGVGYVTNDPFINRYLGALGLTYHVTEVFGVEFRGTFSPDFGKGDWKPITEQIIEENAVTPDISKIQWFGDANFQYSPIYGKVAVSGKNIVMFDIFGAFGAGVVGTRDDLEALQKENDPEALATQKQLHPTLNYGGGIRVILSKSFAFRFETRGMSYVEVIESSTLEMKNNVMLLGSASIFFPGVE